MQCFINPSQHVVPTNVVRRGGSVVHVHGHVEDRRRTGDGERKGVQTSSSEAGRRHATSSTLISAH